MIELLGCALMAVCVASACGRPLPEEPLTAAGDGDLAVAGGDATDDEPAEPAYQGCLVATELPIEQRLIPSGDGQFCLLSAAGEVRCWWEADVGERLLHLVAPLDAVDAGNVVSAGGWLWATAPGDEVWKWVNHLGWETARLDEQLTGGLRNLCLASVRMLLGNQGPYSRESYLLWIATREDGDELLAFDLQDRWLRHPMTLPVPDDVIRIVDGLWPCAEVRDGPPRCLGDVSQGESFTYTLPLPGLVRAQFALSHEQWGDSEVPMGPPPLHPQPRPELVTYVDDAYVLAGCGWFEDGTVTCFTRDQVRAPLWIQPEPLPLDLVPLSDAAGAPLTDIVELAQGTRHACLRRSTGAVACWGANDYGQLGLGTNDLERHPHPIELTMVHEAPVAALVASGHATCALHTDESLTCWGKLGGKRGAPPHDVDLAHLAPGEYTFTDSLPEEPDP